MLHWICVCHLKKLTPALVHEPLARKRFKSPSLKWVSSHRAYVQMKSSQTGLIAQPKTTKYPQPLKHPQIKEKTARPDMREKVTDSNCSWTKMCSVKQRMELYVSNLIQQLETAVGECRFSPVTPEMCWKNTHSSLRPCRNSLHHQRLLESS